MWVGLLCVFTQLSSAFHMVLVEHVRCAEHGEWVHVDDEHAGTHGSPHGVTAANSTAIAPPSSEDGHHHDHCLTCLERRKAVLVASAATELTTLSQNRDAPSIASESAIDDRPTYCFAPKTSPPA
jgi:hypothetical protein